MGERPPVIHPPTGTTLSCKGWVQEAAYRMIQHNLDPDVAERPDDLVVYGGTGKAARDWPSQGRREAGAQALRVDRGSRCAHAELALAIPLASPAAQ